MILKRSQCGRRREKAFSYAVILPSLLGVLIFFIIPFGMVVRYSLVNNPVKMEYAGMDNYKELAHNTAFTRAARNTAVFSAISVPLVVVLSLGLAVILERNIRGKSIVRSFFLSPLMVPTASVVLVWQVLFHKNGTINQLAEIFGGEPVDWLRSSKGQLAIIMMFLWKNIGYNMILFMSALSNIPMINSFKIFREVYLLTGNYPFDKLYMLQHFMNNTFNQLDYQKLSAAAVLLSVVIIAIMTVLMILESIFGRDVEG